MTTPLAITLRAATVADTDAIWRYNNAPDVRAQSLDPKPISRDAHERWMTAQLTDDNSHLWMIESSEGAVGVVRIAHDAVSPDRGRVSIALDASMRGRGVGRAALARAVQLDDGELVAEIVVDNIASQRIFSACGFVNTGSYRMTDARQVLVFERKAVHAIAR